MARKGDLIAALSETDLQEKYEALKADLQKAEIALYDAENAKKLTAAEGEIVTSDGDVRPRGRMSCQVKPCVNQ